MTVHQKRIQTKGSWMIQVKQIVKVMKVTFTMKVHWIDVLNVGRSSLEQTDIM